MSLRGEFEFGKPVYLGSKYPEGTSLPDLAKIKIRGLSIMKRVDQTTGTRGF
jgi:hypothetical protein